jgi:hypothetical protein
MTAKQDKARKFLEELEKDPKHTTRTPEADRQTRNDRLDDPKFNKKDGNIDPKWRKDKDGNWDHPDFE